MEQLSKENYSLVSKDEVENISKGETPKVIILKNDSLGFSIADIKCGFIDNEYEGFNIDEIILIEKCNDNVMKNALILNRKKKIALHKIANRLHSHLSCVREQAKNYKNANLAQTVNVRRNMKYRLGMPYFKDKDMFACPYNEDYHKMKQNQELPLQSYFVPRLWTINDKDKLAAAAFTHICNNKKSELEKQIQIFNKKKCSKIQEDIDLNVSKLLEEINSLENRKLIASIADSWNSAKILSEQEINRRKTEIRESIDDLQEKISKMDKANIKKELNDKMFNLIEELEQIDSKNYIISSAANWDKKIDWLYISCNELLERHNDMECKFLWDSYINPKNSKRAWSGGENDKLISIVMKYEMQNWEAIACEANVSKSSYQCCIHFFSKLWDKYRKDKWSKDEDDYLMSVVSMCRIGDVIPWGIVTKYFSDRSKIQIYTHYVQCVAPEVKKGPFTLAEDILFNTLMKHYKSFVKTGYYFPNRTLVQLRDRYKISGGDPTKAWTFEDDICILKHVEHYGDRNWANVKIEGKNPACIRHRYNLLKRWISEHPGVSVEHVERRVKSQASISKSLERRCLINKAVEILLEKLNRGERTEAICNIENIEKLITELGGQDYKKSRRGRKPKGVKEDLTYHILEFFKYSYKFPGFKRTKTEESIDESVERINALCNLLSVNLKIPDRNTLENNTLLDEIDLQILSKLSEERSSNETVDQLSEANTSNSNIVSMCSVHPENLDSVCNINLPPEPNTLVGFRAFMLHVPTLKNNGAGFFHHLNAYLPKEYKYATDVIGFKQTKHMIVEQMRQLGTNKEKVLQERELLCKRFKALFKWPAVMSFPFNEPPENPFLSGSSDTLESITSDKESASDQKDATGNTSSVSEETSDDKTTKKPVKKKGRPLKITPKIKKMIDAKRKRKLNRMAENAEQDAKKIHLEETEPT